MKRNINFSFLLFLFFVISLNFAFAEIIDPLGAKGDIYVLLYRILNFLVFKVGPVVFTIMMIVGAFQILFSGANPDLIKSGKKTVMYAIIGYALLILSLSIEAIIKNLFSGGK